MDEKRHLSRDCGLVPARKTLIFAHPFERLADCLAHALENEYPWLQVESVVGWPDFASFSDAPVSLVLLDSRLAGTLNEHLSSWRSLQPDVPFAFVCDDPRLLPSPLGELLTTDAMRGFLPMNMKLDLWLSVVGLMLRGGSYYPLGLLRALAAQAVAADEQHASPSAGSHKGQIAGPPWKGLTDREHQVLASIAKGLPNKRVATELKLSEHTVKIHTHNLIRKLQVNNRTEAAALYLQAAARDRAAS